MDHLASNSLLNSYQSAYCKHHSTETALLCIHDHVVSAIGSQKVSCLRLLDLSAAFDTIDHDILITRFSSWFGIHGSVLSWFKSSVILLLPCQMWNQPVFLVCILLQCPRRLCPWSTTLRRVHHSCCYWAPVPAIDRYLLSAAHSAARPPHAAAAVDRWDRQTDTRPFHRPYSAFCSGGVKSGVLPFRKFLL